MSLVPIYADLQEAVLFAYIYLFKSKHYIFPDPVYTEIASMGRF